MSKQTIFDLKKTKFTITKSGTSGNYDLKAYYCNYLNYYDGTAPQIAKWLSHLIEITIESMSLNNAKEINVTMSWKED